MYKYMDVKALVKMTMTVAHPASDFRSFGRACHTQRSR
jgi:hypothetical protein